MDPNELADRRGDGDLFILDVRREDDYEEWRIEGSHNLPIYDQLLDEDLSTLENSLDEIPKDKEIVVVCVAGITSARAAECLRGHGYNATSIEDGMNGWGRVHVTYEIDSIEGITQIVRPGTGCVSYLVADGDEAIIVDPSIYLDEYLNAADERGVEIVGAVDTHAHADHISGGSSLANELDVPYYLHDDDRGDLDEYTSIAHDETIAVGDRELEVVHTPGHTPGSVSLQFGDALLSGDTVFVRSVGRPDLEGSEEADVRKAAGDLFESLDRLAELPEETVVLPGHFSDEDVRPLTTTLGDLEAENELFGMESKDEFIETIVEGLAEEPANYNEIKAINWGREPLTEEAPDLELGPNNCAAN